MRTRRLDIVLIAAAFTAVGAQAQQSTSTTPVIQTGALGALDGLRVRTVSLVSDASNAALDQYHADEQRLLQSLAVKAGDKASSEALRADLRRLYASGKFDEIALESKRAGDAVDLAYHYKPRYFVGVIYMSGAPRPPSAERLIDATKLQLGEPFSQQKLDDALQRVKRSLSDNGWYQATVAAEVQPNPDSQQAQVSFTVDRGKAAHIGQVRVDGDTGYAPEKILDIAKFHSGHTVTPTRVDRALRRLRKKYQKQGRLEAQLEFADTRYNPATNTVDYDLRVNRGPKIEVKLEGAKIRKGKLKKLIPIYEENAVDEDLLNEGKRNLIDYFQSQGYFDADVEFSQTHAGSQQNTIIYDVDKGVKHKVVSVAITGNKYFGDADLRERMAVQSADLLQRNGRYSQGLAAGDAASIASLYRANGFMDVTVTPEVRDDYGGKKGDIGVRMVINEGVQSRVATLNVEGAEKVSAEDVRALLPSESPGQPYSPSNLSSERDAVLNYYFQHGFTAASMDVSTAKHENDPHAVDLTLRIHEGGQVFVDRTLLYGLKYTRRGVVRRQIELRQGQPFDQTALADSERKLYDLGIFNAVDTALQNPDGTAEYKNVILHMDEARRYTLNYGLGFEAQTGQVNSSGCSPSGKTTNCNPSGNFGFSPRVEFDVSRINFRGRDETITFKSHYGRLQKRALLSYEAPRVLRHPSLTFTATTFYDNTQDVLSFTAKRIEGSAELKQQVNKATTLVYRYAYRRVSVSDVFVTPDQVPLLSQPVRVGIPTFTWVRDTRDDPLDSTRGTYNTADFGVSWTKFGSSCSSALIASQDPNLPNGQCPDPNFSRAFMQNTTYYAFGGSRRRWVLARSTRFGSERSFGFLQGQVPLAERFFAGGSNSHRGFAINQAGPRDSITGFPIGGNAEFVNSFELRTPAIGLPYVGENLSAVLFHDLGNVFDNTNRLFNGIFRFHQPNQEQCRTDPNTACNFNFSSNAIGAGVRYRTPIGPVRVDFGYNLNPPLYHRTVTDLQDPTRTVFETTHTQRLNVFFSIGQTF